MKKEKTTRKELLYFLNKYQTHSSQAMYSHLIADEKLSSHQKIQLYSTCILINEFIHKLAKIDPVKVYEFLTRQICDTQSLFCMVHGYIDPEADPDDYFQEMMDHLKKL